MSNKTKTKDTDDRPCGCDIMFKTKNLPYLCTRKNLHIIKDPLILKQPMQYEYFFSTCFWAIDPEEVG